jgi:dTDP-4-dehydrorhamnose 3,5-epimerase-like enzyme
MTVKDHVSFHQLGATRDQAALERGRGYVSEKQGAKAVFVHNGEPMRFLAYLEFTSGMTRGNHFHERKLEHLAVVSGLVRAKFVLPEAPDDILEATLETGDVVTIAPGCVHSYYAADPAVAVEFSPNGFEAKDTLTYLIEW